MWKSNTAERLAAKPSTHTRCVQWLSDTWHQQHAASGSRPESALQYLTHTGLASSPCGCQAVKYYCMPTSGCVAAAATDLQGAGDAVLAVLQQDVVGLVPRQPPKALKLTQVPAPPGERVHK
jgi:hypothetical protein